jgi:hypothetical protein
MNVWGYFLLIYIRAYHIDPWRKKKFASSADDGGGREVNNPRSRSPRREYRLLFLPVLYLVWLLPSLYGAPYGERASHRHWCLSFMKRQVRAKLPNLNSYYLAFIRSLLYSSGIGAYRNRKLCNNNLLPYKYYTLSFNVIIILKWRYDLSIAEAFNLL